MAPANNMQTSKKLNIGVYGSRKPKIGFYGSSKLHANHTQTLREPNIGVYGSCKSHANLTQTFYKGVWLPQTTHKSQTNLL